MCRIILHKKNHPMGRLSFFTCDAKKSHRLQRRFHIIPCDDPKSDQNRVPNETQKWSKTESQIDSKSTPKSRPGSGPRIVVGSQIGSPDRRFVQIKHRERSIRTRESHPDRILSEPLRTSLNRTEPLRSAQNRKRKTCLFLVY